MVGSLIFTLCLSTSVIIPPSQYLNDGLLDLNSSLQTILTYRFEDFLSPFLLPFSVAIVDAAVLLILKFLYTFSSLENVRMHFISIGIQFNEMKIVHHHRSFQHIDHKKARDIWIDDRHFQYMQRIEIWHRRILRLELGDQEPRSLTT